MKLIWLLVLIAPSICFSAKDFPSALTEILGRSPELRAQNEKIRSLKINRLAGQLRMAPELSVTSTTSDSSLSTENTKSLNGLVNWNLFRWGADYHYMKAQSYGLKSGRSEFNVIYLEAERRGAFAIMEVIHAKQQVGILEKILKLKKEAAQVATERFKKGLIPETEVLKGQVDVSNIMARLKDSQVTLRTKKIDLQELLGSIDVEVAWPWLDYLKSTSSQELIKREFKFENRPDFLVALNNFRQQESMKQNAKYAILPTLDFSLRRGKTSQGSLSQWETIGMLTVSMPIFEGLSDYALYRSRKATEEARQQSLVSTARRAQAEVEGRKDIYQRSLETALERMRVLKLAQKLYKRSINRFRKGRLTFNELSIDMDRFYLAESLNASGLLEVHKSLLRLCHSQAHRVDYCF